MSRPGPQLLAAALLALLPARIASASLPPTALSYTINVSVDPVSREFRGAETIHWRNRAQTEIGEVPLHLYLNAFANEGSTWLQEARKSGFERFDLDAFYKLFDDPWGWIDLMDVRVAGGEEEVPWRPIQPDDGNVLDRSLVRLDLPRPVPPGGELALEVRFSGRLPRPFARTGCVDRYCLVGQWFPKVAVLETKGVRGASGPRWAARQFHASSEFYADFADFDVTIEAPEGWLVTATGRRDGEPVAEGSGLVRHHFQQRAVHDFAFMLGRDFEERVIAHDQAGEGGTVEVSYVLPREFEDQLPRWREAAEGTLDTLGRSVGPYPYDTLTIVLPRLEGARTEGMEFPTFVVASTVGRELEAWPRKSVKMAEQTLIHELTHQYFYGLLASNEQEEAFLDEGFTTYWSGRTAEALYGAENAIGSLFGRPLAPMDIARLGLATAANRIREPLRHEPSALFEGRTHALQFYARTAVTLGTLERLFGRETTDRIFRAYYDAFAFHHPSAEDFLAVARESAGEEAEAFLRETFGRGRLPDYSVVRLRVRREKTPLGSWPRPEGRVTVERKIRDEHRDILDLPVTRDEGGKVWIEVTDPGWFREGSSRYGKVSWVGFEPVVATAPEGADRETKAGEKAPLYESEVKINGPGWDHLPVPVELRFDDGTVIRDRWDGRAPWRAYRAVRRARLVEVVVDPDDVILLDPKPENNGRSSKPAKPFLADWFGWAAAAAQWVGSGISLWL